MQGQVVTGVRPADTKLLRWQFGCCAALADLPRMCFFTVNQGRLTAFYLQDKPSTRKLPVMAANPVFSQQDFMG
jgi:hypothetical protein